MTKVEIELNKYLERKSIKESWVRDNLPNLYNYLLDKVGNSISEKVYLLNNKRGVCKVCDAEVVFLSIDRGYRNYCSKKCANNDVELIKKKLSNAKITNLEKYGVDNPSKSQIVQDKIIKTKSNSDYKEINRKIKNTTMEKYGVDNVSKLEETKNKKKNTWISNWGVDNVFKSDEIKGRIKDKLLESYGVEHPLKSEFIKNKIKNNNIEKWGVDNYTKTKEYKERIFEKYKSGDIKTLLNSDVNYISYKGLGTYELTCDCGLEHSYITNTYLFYARNKNKNKQCTVCYPVSETSSFKELELYDYIKSIYSGEVIRSYKNKLEIDIYLSDLKIGFEFNGLYWHSEIFKDKNYHLDKTEFFKEEGIRLIHIWEDDWEYKKEIVKSQIKNWLGVSKNKIYARNCEIREIDSKDEYRNFLNDNHIQGYSSSSVRIGLYYKGLLVSLMTFDHFEGRKKMKDDEWNLARFCNRIETNVIGGASKLLNYFIKKYSPIRIISFADRSWSEGNLYKNLGFSIKSISKPNYSYLVERKRSNKQKWKKSNLIKMGFDGSLSESRIMENNFGAYKIFDCGQIKFEINFPFQIHS